jgi:hypothetical protein
MMEVPALVLVDLQLLVIGNVFLQSMYTSLSESV